MHGRESWYRLLVLATSLLVLFGLRQCRQKYVDHRQQQEAVQNEREFIRHEIERLNARMDALERGKDSLVKQIIWIEAEKSRLWKPQSK